MSSTGTPARSARPVLAGAAALLLVLATSACGATTDRGAAPTTTPVDPADAPNLLAPTTTADPADFDTVLASLTQRLDSVDGDLCELVATLDSAVEAGNPTTEEQARVAARFLGTAYEKIADAAPPTAGAHAAEIKKGAESMLAEAERPTLDVEQFTEDGPAAFRDQKFLTAMSKLFTMVRNQCGWSTTTGG